MPDLKPFGASLRINLELSGGTEDFLDCVYSSRTDRRLRPAAVVGARSNHSYCCRELVGGVQERLVLNLLSAWVDDRSTQG